ncbi:hypothetical protein D5086_013844 [Populus alba]|uniref:Uncharacterized protein n=1 Tax=Populus alba TaxID=43335 RepID=A0ACC4C7G3_POPAL
MVGGGSRRDEGSLVINSTNVFAALETLRKKKKSDKERVGSKSGKGGSKSGKEQQSKEPDPEVFWAPAKLTAKSWADVDDEDDDDYYATTAPPPSVWGSSDQQQSEEKSAHVEESESEEDILDEGDDDVEEEHDHEPEAVHPEPVVKKTPEVPLPPKETERQLSKKERKKKELAELEALLADFGVAQKDSNGQDESHDAAQEKKDGETHEEGDKKENVAGESKNAKKKKKKDKSAKEPQDQPTNSEANNRPEEVAGAEHAEEDASAVDMKERLKRMASAKKKKSGKEMDGGAKAAAQEAAARSARLAAAKKKEKNHYNQQPVRLDQVQVAGGRSGRMLDCVAALMQMRFRQSWVEKRISLLRELYFNSRWLLLDLVQHLKLAHMLLIPCIQSKRGQ